MYLAIFWRARPRELCDDRTVSKRILSQKKGRSTLLAVLHFGFALVVRGQNTKVHACRLPTRAGLMGVFGGPATINKTPKSNSRSSIRLT